MTLEREEILKAKQQQAFNIYGNFISKGRGYPVGTKRKWGKHWYEKQMRGWKYMGETKEENEHTNKSIAEDLIIKMQDKWVDEGEYKQISSSGASVSTYFNDYIRVSDHATNQYGSDIGKLNVTSDGEGDVNIWNHKGKLDSLVNKLYKFKEEYSELSMPLDLMDNKQIEEVSRMGLDPDDFDYEDDLKKKLMEKHNLK